MVARRRCLNVLTNAVQVPTPDVKLAARGYRINLHCQFTRASVRPSRRWRKLYHASSSSCLSLAVCEFHNAERGTLRTRLQTVCAKLCCQMSWHLKHIRMIAAMYIHEVSGPTYFFDSPCKNLAWWAVTQRTSRNHRTVKIGRYEVA